MKIDVEYAIHLLIKQYGGRKEEMGQHPVWTLEQWQTEVEKGQTGLGYWQYVILRIMTDETDNGDHSVETEVKRSLRMLTLLALQVNEKEGETLNHAGCTTREGAYIDEYDDYPAEHWVDEVLCYETRLGYWAWLAEQIGEAASEDDRT